jgi:hypothetical protein
MRDGLLDAIFEDAEVFLLETGNGAVEGIADSDGDEDEVGIDAQVGGWERGGGRSTEFGAGRSGDLGKESKREKRGDSDHTEESTSGS